MKILDKLKGRITKNDKDKNEIKIKCSQCGKEKTIKAKNLKMAKQQITRKEISRCQNCGMMVWDIKDRENKLK